ncbi:hypothetical protein D9615_002454 [Tricholomella constricta]|uniref:CAP-Gly domain-containing protein n=1 Tax=Tricholomella constricta TaxID=117010 RepID=A0A8H5M9L3_9AGAR|nr:hypothetical protein D9615_002454 [Tricholomella constricta]
MSATPGKLRQSGIPGPGRASGIPTPGRSRASSTVIQQNAPQADVEYMSRAFADAIKANDPAQHRSSYTNGASSASLSPQSASISQSGRRSVAARPSSVASTSSTTSSTYPRERAKTPVSARPPSRPPSRHSDVFARSAPRAFEVGDNVRIESLGYEGTLRYVGEIEGKLGLWAGVEFSGGFSGKGKNNGTVNGIQYFSCPDNCGVFVATTKLSPPTVGVGAIPRPPSVASSRGGRVTPALSGRMTPSGSSSISGSRMTTSSSLSNGRITPSISGRVTPSFSSGRITPGTTPAARARRTLAKSTASKPEVPVPLEQFTAGSRASKYMSMTAKQLSSRDAASGSPRQVTDLDSPTRSQSSPSHYQRSTASPTRSIGSPFSTPKPGLGGRVSGIGGGLPTPNKNRPSLSTPRARIPSAIAMPPPASPMSSRSVSLNDHSAGDSLESDVYGKPVQERGALFKSASATASARSDSVASIRSISADDRGIVDQLQSGIDALEYDNERLRAVEPPTITAEAGADHLAKLQAVQQERNDAVSKITTLEAALAASKDDLEGERTRLNSLEEDKRRTISALEDQNHGKELTLAALQAKLDTKLTLVSQLQAQVDTQGINIQQNESFIMAKDKTIASLELKLAAVSAELQDEKNELGTQIDELRSAGQETIALYEERLNAADSQRYDFEQRIITLETRLHNAQKASSPPPASFGVSSAAEIDNETLREQVLHLQRKIATMEDTIEDAQATAERDEAVMRERMKRLKEKEDAMRKELSDGRKEVERVLKSEANARGRVEEIEEALRESTVALENARAEVEGLRAELANLDGLVANSTGGDLSYRVAEAAQRAANDKVRYMEEITKLQDSLEQYRAREQMAVSAGSEISEVRRENTLLQEKLCDQTVKLDALSQSLDETSKELETLRKKNNRDATINNGLQDALRPIPASPSSKYDLSAAREEITGLKHIVQELQKENLASAQRIKILESENQLLSSEANQLRQEVQILEENLDKSLDQEEIVDSLRGGSEDSPRKLKEQQSRLEMEQEQLRKKLVDAEMKSARTIHDLNKEISELEALVESKIYREDELEQELERMREKLARQSKKSSKSSTDTIDSRSTVGVGGEQVCEICERPGHDIFSCDVLNKEAPVTLRYHIGYVIGNLPSTLGDDAYDVMVAAACLYKTWIRDIRQRSPLFAMSYASVAATNAPPPSEQPQPDPALLNTTPPTASNTADDTAKVKLVPNPATISSEARHPIYDSDDDEDDDPHPSKKKKKANRRLKEVEAEGIYLWEVTKHYLFRPGVAGGLVGLVNLGLLAGAGRAFYTQPHLRRDRVVVSSTVAATVALLSAEGYAAEKYRQTARGQAEERRSKEEGTLIYKHLREQILRPGVLGGIVGLVNAALLGTVGYFSYVNWGRPTWDRRIVSAVTVGLLTLWGGEGYIAERYRQL